ncbi:MAG TPA: hypothetical protein VJT75_08955 [Thermoleophilaceae bacterium]|nr:hypothetical protein [Thermoleophilaceae bacterium]
MRLHRLAVAASAAAAITIPAQALAAPPSPHQLSIAAQPNPVVFGKPVAITGKLTGDDSAGEDVTLREDPFPFGNFNNLGSTNTAADGTYKFTATPTVNTKYQATAKSKSPATSPELTVTVATRVGLVVSDTTPKVGQTVTFKGRVYPPHDGQNVLLQRKAKTGWKTVATIKLVDAGDTFSFYSRKRTVNTNGAFRVIKPADSDHARGLSPKRTLTVHG